MASFSQLGLQEGVSSIMGLIIFFHDYMMVLLSVIMIFVSYIFIIILIRSGVDKYLIDSHFLELVWTIVPIVFLLFMAFPSLYLLYMTEDSHSPRVRLKVLGHQWYWEYEYSFLGKVYSFDSYLVSGYLGVSSSLFRNLDVDNRLVIPVGSTSLALISSADVLHSWTVPSLGVKADATPGRLNFVSLAPLTSGVYYGQCSELCGSNHSFIPICVESLPSVGFLRFVYRLMS